MGMPHLAIVVVPHPIGGIGLDEVKKKAHLAMEDMISILTMPRENLIERSKSQV